MLATVVCSGNKRSTYIPPELERQQVVLSFAVVPDEGQYRDITVGITVTDIW